VENGFGKCFGESGIFPGGIPDLEGEFLNDGERRRTLSLRDVRPLLGRIPTLNQSGQIELGIRLIHFALPASGLGVLLPASVEVA
jgi:hypothetical protein